MSTESTPITTEEHFLAVTGEWIPYDSIVSRRRVAGESPDDPDAYLITYLPKGSTEPDSKWVSYYVYCALKPYERTTS